MLSAFVTLYKLDAPQWSSIEQLTKALNWTEMASLTATEFFLDNGVSERFIHEQIEAGSLVNYAQVRPALNCSFSAELSYAECR